MMVWLLGVEAPLRCIECAGIEAHAPNCPLGENAKNSEPARERLGKGDYE
jgi:hypothetical protein